jgi:hypothetical protein
MNELPIACTLTGAERVDRKAEWTAITAEWMTAPALTERGVSMRFDARAEPRLRELIAAESECCAFLDFELTGEGSGLRLTVEGPYEARPIILAIFGL